MKILHISCSPRGTEAESYRLAHRIIGRLLQRHPQSRLLTRTLGDGRIPHIDENYAQAQQSAASAAAAADHPFGSVAVSDELIGELESADVVVIGTPMHNLTLPSSLKAWIDHVVRAHRTFRLSSEGKTGVLRDRPVYVAIASGGRFSGEGVRQQDFLTPYLRIVLGTIGLHDITFFSVEGTGAGPEAIAAGREKAERQLQTHFTSPACV